MKCTSCDAGLSTSQVTAHIQDENKGVVEVVIICKECHATYSKLVNFNEFDET